MDLSHLALVVGMVFGAVMIGSVCVVYVKRSAFGMGGGALTVLGVLLIGMSVWSTARFEVSPQGLKVQVDQLIREVQDVKEEAQALSGQAETLSEEVRTTREAAQVLVEEVRTVQTTTMALSEELVAVARSTSAGNEQLVELARELQRRQVLPPEVVRELQEPVNQAPEVDLERIERLPRFRPERLHELAIEPPEDASSPPGDRSLPR